MNKLLHFKLLSDLKTIIDALEALIKKKNQGVLLSRPTEDGRQPTIYPEQNNGNYRTVMGVRI